MTDAQRWRVYEIVFVVVTEAIVSTALVNSVRVCGIVLFFDVCILMLQKVQILRFLRVSLGLIKASPPVTGAPVW